MYNVDIRKPLITLHRNLSKHKAESMWQDLENTAWDHMNAGNTVQAAIAARLAISEEPDAIDCYVILAQASDVLGQKQAYAREATRLGEQTFAEEIKSALSEDFPFWSVLETRPNMRGSTPCHSIVVRLLRLQPLSGRSPCA